MRARIESDRNDKYMNTNNSTTTKGTVILQTEVSQETKYFLKLESLHRGITMGALINQLVEGSLPPVSEKTS